MLEAALLLRASKALKTLPGQVVTFSLDQPTISLLSKVTPPRYIRCLRLGSCGNLTVPFPIHVQEKLAIFVTDGDGHPAELAYLSATVHDVDGTPIVQDFELEGSGGQYHLDLLNNIYHGGQFRCVPMLVLALA